MDQALDLPLGRPLEQAPLVQEMQAIIDTLHMAKDNPHHHGWGRRKLNNLKRRLREILVELGEIGPHDDASAWLTVLADQTSLARVTEVPLDGYGQERTFGASLDDYLMEGGMLRQQPEALRAPSVEEELFNPPTYTNDIKRDGKEDRRINFLYQMFRDQPEELEALGLEQPLDNLTALAFWVAARALLRGMDRIRVYRKDGEVPYVTVEDGFRQATSAEREDFNAHWPKSPCSRTKTVPRWVGEAMAAVLAEFYPAIALDTAAVRQLSRTLDLHRQRKPEDLAPLFRVRGALETVSAMMETYCNNVKATREADEAPPQRDLPEIPVPTSDPKRQPNLHQVANTYRVTGSPRGTARAFRMNYQRMLDHLSTLRLAS